MGALAGSISVRRYRVLDALPADPRGRLTRGVRSHVFMPLDPKAEADRSFGWVSIADSNDAELRADKLFFVAAGGEQLRLALRIDTLKAPAAELKRQLRARVAEKEAKEGRALRKSEKAALKDELTRKLRQRAFPQVRVVDVVWNLDGKRLYLWSQVKSVNELFLDLFVRSFGLRLEIEGPGRWAAGAVDKRELEKLEPTPELWRGFTGLRPLQAAKEDE